MATSAMDDRAPSSWSPVCTWLRSRGRETRLVVRLVGVWDVTTAPGAPPRGLLHVCTVFFAFDLYSTIHVTPPNRRG